jgi:hypothetical protein
MSSPSSPLPPLPSPPSLAPVSTTIGGDDGAAPYAGAVPSAQSFIPSFAIWCGGAGAGTVCSAAASIIPCGLFDGVDCSISTGAYVYPCATPGYVLV